MNNENNKTILLVEDEEIIAILEKKILVKYQYNIITASSGEEAIEIVEKNPGINLILMDINLGDGIDGTRAAEIILKSHDVPLIFLSSHTERDVVEKTEGITSYGYIVKNSGETVLIASIKMAFRLFNANRKIAESEYFFKESQRAAFIGSYKADLITGNWESSEVLDQIFGIDKSFNRTLQDWMEIIHPDDREMIARYFKEEVILKVSQFNRECRIVHKSSGMTRWVYVSGEISTNNEGNVISITGVIQDITEKKLAEEIQRENEAKLKLTINDAPICVAMVGMDKRFLQCNTAFCDFLGYTEDEMKGKSIIDITYKEDAALGMEDLKAIAAGKKKTSILQKRYARKDGAVVWGEIYINLIRNSNGQPMYFLPIIRDITESKIAEQIIIKSEDKFSKAFKASPASISINTMDDGRYIDVNEAFLISTGHERNEVVGHTVDELNFWVDNSERRKYIKVLFEKGSLKDFEVRYRMKNGEIRDFLISSEIIELEGKRCSLNFILDINERRESMKAIKKSEEKFSKAFQATPASISILTMDEGRYIDVNDLFLKTTGYQKDEVVGRTVDDIKAWVDNNERIKFIKELAINGSLKDLEVHYRMKNGEIRNFLISCEIIELEGKQCSLNFILDITERKLAEQAIKKSEEKFYKVFKASMASITIASIEDGRYIDVNDVFLETTGYMKDEVIGHTSTELNFWIDVNDRRRFIEELSMNGSLKDFEVRYRMRNGEIKDFLVSSEIIELEGKRCSLNFNLNITDLNLKKFCLPRTSCQ